ncbi:MAG: haloacid dehalogenase [Phenylobacterium sp.]|uniref:HAD family hydrolase n=1 Tax=Phenylobacterium sp. TaxID=1871053 RepID=UPI0025F59F55|nr:HAD-IA family hydrolase [Phenylobacterium sp.]MBA4012937.1 haloacid dehalogenase [Phenylobacterium sp.]
MKALMVDVDGVIVVHPDPGGWAVHLERDLGLSKARLQEAFFAPHFDDVVHGRAALRERLAPVLAEIAPHLSCDELCAYWFREDGYLDHDLLEQLAAVRAEGYALHLATVQEHERAAYLWNEMGLKDRFDAIHYAADLGHAKPADGFYAAIEARTGYAPGDLFFIDDRIANVQAAQARGWKAALWTGHERLADLMARA